MIIARLVERQSVHFFAAHSFPSLDPAHVALQIAPSFLNYSDAKHAAPPTAQAAIPSHTISFCPNQLETGFVRRVL